MNRNLTQSAVRRAGGSSRLAAMIGVSRQAVQQWGRVPAEHVLLMERESGVSRHRLRPDIFGRPPKKESV